MAYLFFRCFVGPQSLHQPQRDSRQPIRPRRRHSPTRVRQPARRCLNAHEVLLTPRAVRSRTFTFLFAEPSGSEVEPPEWKPKERSGTESDHEVDDPEEHLAHRRTRPSSDDEEDFTRLNPDAPPPYGSASLEDDAKLAQRLRDEDLATATGYGHPPRGEHKVQSRDRRFVLLPHADKTYWVS